MNLADMIIENGPYGGGDMLPAEVRAADAEAVNELREELIAARRLLARKCCGFGARSITAEHVFGGAGSCCTDKGDREGLVTSYEEWRVTGTWWDMPYTATYRTEREARRFIDVDAREGIWLDGPHLHRRTVTVTEWETA